MNTVLKLLRELGAACAAYLDEQLRFVDCRRIQADEIWSFVHAKAKNVPEDKRETFGFGDVWTWTAMCSEDKLIISWLVGERSSTPSRSLAMGMDERCHFRGVGHHRLAQSQVSHGLPRRLAVGHRRRSGEVGRPGR